MNEKLDDNSKEDHSLFINSFIDHEVINVNISLPLSALLTSFFIIQKLNDNLIRAEIFNDKLYLDSTITKLSNHQIIKLIILAMQQHHSLSL